MSNSLRSCPAVFRKWLYYFAFPQQSVMRAGPYLSQHLGLSVLLCFFFFFLAIRVGILFIHGISFNFDLKLPRVWPGIKSVDVTRKAKPCAFGATLLCKGELSSSVGRQDGKSMSGSGKSRSNGAQVRKGEPCPGRQGPRRTTAARSL